MCSLIKVENIFSRYWSNNEPDTKTFNLEKYGFFFSQLEKIIEWINECHCHHFYVLIPMANVFLSSQLLGN